MRIRSRSHPRIPSFAHLLLSTTALCIFAEAVSSGVVTLKSLEIYQTHEWIFHEPTVYFRCHGENKTVLPDVKKTKDLYEYNGEESWQPLTELPDDKCKRCGFFKENLVLQDDAFDVWELCADCFKRPDGLCTRSKNKEFNATFLCPQCISSTVHSSRSTDGDHKKRTNILLVISVTAATGVVSIIMVVVLYKYWQRRKRDQEHARFLRLFEESDDIEAELELGHTI